MNKEEYDELSVIEYNKFIASKQFFNLDCYYCIHEQFCDKAHTWNTGTKECYKYRVIVCYYKE